METIGERIKYIRKDKNKLTLDVFGKRVGISAASISALELGKNNPSEQTIKLICREFGVNEIWLRTGSGEPYAPKSRAEEITEFVGKTIASGSPMQQAFISVLARTTVDEWELFERKLRELLDEVDDAKEDDP